ncbi:hypothetical protein Q1695_003741 [Nippostrongylus brasiliensis]|nr:hypothetical protein Q1695_003741 [Nippostrongylus brasiliensis]
MDDVDVSASVVEPNLSSAETSLNGKSNESEACEEPTVTPTSPSCEEPTEEQVANAMRLSGAGDGEAPSVKESESTATEGPCSEDVKDEGSNDSDDPFVCPACGSIDDPPFMHYKKFPKPISSNYGAFIWRYRCARSECNEFFGEFFAYDKVSNSFVHVSEELTAVDEEDENVVKSEIPNSDNECAGSKEDVESSTCGDHVPSEAGASADLEGSGVDDGCVHEMDDVDVSASVVEPNLSSAETSLNGKSNESEACEEPTVTPTSPSCEEPTEEQVANAMRLSGAGDGEAPSVKESESTATEGPCSEDVKDEGSNDSDDPFVCPACGSIDDPPFMHYKKFSKPISSNYGAFIWRYRCARSECNEFFGEFFAYDKVSNSFVHVSEEMAAADEEDENVVKSEIPNSDNEYAGSKEDVESSTCGDHVPSEAGASADLEDTSAAAESNETVPTAEDSKVEEESLPEQRVQVVSNRSSRRQRQSARKKTVVVIKPKVRAETKKAEKPAPSPKPVKEVKTRAPPRRRGAAAQAEKPEPAPAPAAPKRLRKGYVYEVVPAAVPPPQSVPSVSAAVVNGYRAPCRSECGTQTMGGSHIFSALIDQFINGQAEKCAGSISETPSTLPSFVSRRLMVSQQLLMRQNDELNRVQEENRRLLDLIKHMNSIIRKFGDEYAPELRHLRDAIGVLKRELLFYQEEFVAEAKKSINNIQAQKEEVQQRIDDAERKHRLLNASSSFFLNLYQSVYFIYAKIDLHIKEKEAAEERADGYLREISVRDRDVILANKSKERAERKLNDTLYVANNAKCAHCQISDKMRAHLTDVVAEKTVLLDKCRKECGNEHYPLLLQRRADHAERISKILSKDSEKLRFELNTWKSDAERNVSEIARLREELKKSTASQQSNSNASPPKAKVEIHTPKQVHHCDSPVLSNSDAKSLSSNGTVKTVERDEYTNTSPVANAKIASNAVQTPQVAPMVSTPTDDPHSPFSSWLPKGRKVDSSPPVSFFNAPQPSARQPSAQIPSRRPFPFNGPVVADGFLGKDVVRTDEKTSERTPILSSEPRTSAISPAPSDRLAEPPVPNVERQVPLMPKKKKKKATAKGTDSFDTIGPPRFFGGGKPSREAFIPDRVEPFSGPFPHSEPRKRKNSETDFSRINRAAHIAPAQCARPFNGPISLSGGMSSSSRPSLQPTSQPDRSKFSSSPLPWHRAPQKDYNEWESSVTEHSSPSRGFDNRNQYESDLNFGRPFGAKPRKNFWEP